MPAAGSTTRSRKPKNALAHLDRILPREKRKDPASYVAASEALLNDALAGKIATVDLERLQKRLEALCKTRTGMTLEEAAQQDQDVVSTQSDLLDRAEADLKKFEAAFKRIDDARITEGLKKKCSRIVKRILALHQQAREDPAKFAALIGKDDTPARAGEPIELAPCHLWMYDTWMDPGQQHALVEAPVGHGKSTNMRYFAAWEIGNHPEFRTLYITDKREKAEAALTTVWNIIRSERYRAVFPDIRVLGRTDKAKENAGSFTVARKNVFARDPTFFAAGIRGTVQGSRFDRIYGDDVCPEDVRDQPNIRRMCVSKWNSVIEGRVGDSHARIRMICTPWHPDDVAGTIIRDAEEGRRDNWRIEIDRFRICDDENGKAVPIWPEQWPTKFLEEQKIKLGAEYEYLFRLKFASTSMQVVSRLWPYNAKREPATVADQKIQQMLRKSERWLSIDPAGTTGYNSSETGVVEVSLGFDRQAYVSNCWFFRCGAADLIDELLQLVVAAPAPGYVGIQWEAQGAVKVALDSSVQLLRQKIEQLGLPVPAMVITDASVGTGRTNKSKTTRLRQCAGFLEYGIVRFAGHRQASPAMPNGVSPPRELPGGGIATLMSHIRNFDGTNRTDGVDALTQWILQNSGRLKAVAQAVEGDDVTDPTAGGDGGFGQMMAKQIAERQKPKKNWVDEEEDFLMAAFSRTFARSA